MFKGKRILITQPIVRGFAGSTLVTLELAEQFQKFGAKVTVFTCDYADPAKTCFEQKKIKVDVDQDSPKYKIKVDVAHDSPQYKLQDFDYIWVHSQILPISIIQELSQKLPNKKPTFIFLHMSGMDWIPDEKPWIYDLENRLSSLSLFISEEVLEINRSFLNQSIPIAFFRNPVPESYQNRANKPNTTLKNLLIVSNHPPKEILEARDLLKNKYHINVSSLGESQDNYQLFNKTILEKYDAIITIAKTVPYCLVSGTPVYVYDSFGGGPGWLNEKNYELAKKRNFSGYQNAIYPKYEGGVFHYKTAHQITEEIIHGYSDSLSFHHQNQQSFYDEFTLKSSLSQIFNNIKPRNISIFQKKYTDSVIAAEQFATTRFETGGFLYIRDDRIRDLEKTQRILEAQNSELTSFKKEAEKVFSSRAYRVFDHLIKPYKKLTRKEKND